VNHTFADLKPGDENSFMAEHRANFEAAVACRIQEMGKVEQEVQKK
jgi:hypothetical protein